MSKPEENKTFRLELGINLHAAPVPQTNPNMRIFPLQNALIDTTDGDMKPAWYSRLGIGDEISFRLVDISNRRGGPYEPDYPDLALAEFYFNNPSTGRPANPFTEEVVGWQFSKRLDDQHSPVYSLNEEHLLPSWDLIARSSDGQQHETLKFAAFQQPADDECDDSFRAFELTVAIKMVKEGWVNHFVFDPEMIISETDNEGDGSGGGKKK